MLHYQLFIIIGIQQSDVEKAPIFPVVLTSFNKWIESNDHLIRKKWIIITCGDWDLETMLPNQCALNNVPVPSYAKNWINIKKEFCRLERKEFNYQTNDLLQMITHFGLIHNGRLHSGKDDILNLKNVIEKLCCKGILMKQF